MADGVWVEIFRAGKQTSGTGYTKVWTEDDLDQMVANFGETKEVRRPPLRLGQHAEGVAPQVGGVDALRRVGSNLEALFGGVPDVVKTAINKRLYRTVSSGIRENFEVAGKTYKLLLDHVAILGHLLPAVTGLNDLSKLFNNATDEDGEIRTYEFTNKERKIMDEILELKTKNLELKASNDRLMKEAEAAQKAAEENFSAVESKSREEITGLQSRIADFEQKEMKSKVEAVVDDAVKAGRLTPALRDDQVTAGMGLIINHSDGEDSAFAAWEKSLKNAPKVVDFTEKGEDNDGGGNEGQDDFAEGVKIAQDYQKSHDA